VKPVDFDYHRPAAVPEAVALLARYGGEASLIAGGQSLMPMLAFRLARPAALIDVAGIPGLDRIEPSPDGGLRIGARVTQAALERTLRESGAQPLLAEAVRHVAHYQIRNRGTVGGSLAQADPAAELPAMAVACGGRVVIAGTGGERTVPAGDFVAGPMTTDLAEDEMIVALDLPTWPAGRRWGFAEFARRTGDFALAGIAAFADADDEGRLVDPVVAVFGATDRPMRLAAAEAALAGRRPDGPTVARAVAAARETVEPASDPRVPEDYRRALVATLTGDVLAHAVLGREAVAR